MTSTDNLRKPILPGKGASDYELYLRTDELLSLQKSPEEAQVADVIAPIIKHAPISTKGCRKI